MIHDKPEKVVKSRIACLCSFFSSIVGVSVLVWWEIIYHASNTQQWMVPLGLVLFCTPVIAWFSVFVSEIYMDAAAMITAKSLPDTSKIESFNGLFFKRWQERVFSSLDMVNLTHILKDPKPSEDAEKIQTWEKAITSLLAVTDSKAYIRQLFL
ncbi:hypothetical protein HHK36_029246 [Tetracentron sinense]|uniref:Uncharacterized protein n=1 Tax=Tetracentron sinense TaxID=13715 RepID=A0A835D142_TETSI|nr:hypothetical protein HHK36_029246 [Tetracentron sinense]